MAEKKRIFSISPSEHLRIEQEISDEVDPARLNFISIENLQDQNVHYLTRCGICSGLAHNPVQDEECEQLFCKYCIEKALQTSQKCPVTNCPANFEAAKKISKEKKEFLDKALVDCRGGDCDEFCPPLKVNDVLVHRRVCFVQKRPCIFGCGQTLKEKNEHLRHAREDCPRVDTTCQTCAGHSIREKQHEHNCAPNLINQIE
jgi:hypothetical protein